MPRHFHGIVQDSTDDDPAVFCSIDQEMSGATHNTRSHARMFPTETQVPGTNTFAKLWTFNAAGPIRLGGNVTQRGHNQGRIAFASRFAKPLVCPSQNLDEVGLSRGR